ncbi:ribokinase [Xylophilus sp. ASV27]|uniref:ribokinase n=1 Tax=Xylophilus sp. ASV27 TaxID=2795129 RepID=UPI0018EAA7B2|nr:ribokinase [Xylophilus sp. ASV27]
MAILNIGSINIDHRYRVERFVQPGETLPCRDYARGLGGKGMNQSIALHRAGAQVCHLGAIGHDDTWVRAAIADTGVALDALVASPADTGHAIIQVDAAGENCILLHPGANHALSAAHVSAALARHPQHGWVLTQNETSVVADAIQLACAAGRKVAFNPAPCEPSLAGLPLERLALLLVNEVEARQLSGRAGIGDAFAALRQRCPQTLVVMTLGADGLWAALGDAQWRLPAHPAHVVDTTAAGDAVTGYLLAGLDGGMDPLAALDLALKAAAITVSRHGAAASIPLRGELLQKFSP